MSKRYVALPFPGKSGNAKYRLCGTIMNLGLHRDFLTKDRRCAHYRHLSCCCTSRIHTLHTVHTHLPTFRLPCTREIWREQQTGNKNKRWRTEDWSSQRTNYTPKSKSYRQTGKRGERMTRRKKDKIGSGRLFPALACSLSRGVSSRQSVVRPSKHVNLAAAYPPPPVVCSSSTRRTDHEAE